MVTCLTPVEATVSTDKLQGGHQFNPTARPGCVCVFRQGEQEEHRVQHIHTLPAQDLGKGQD